MSCGGYENRAPMPAFKLPTGLLGPRSDDEHIFCVPMRGKHDSLSCKSRDVNTPASSVPWYKILGTRKSSTKAVPCCSSLVDEILPLVDRVCSIGCQSLRARLAKLDCNCYGPSRTFSEERSLSLGIDGILRNNLCYKDFIFKR